MNSTEPIIAVNINVLENGTTERTEASVYTSNQLVYHLPKILVLLHIATTRHSDLDEHNFPDPLRVLIQEHFEGVQLLRDALDVVQTVDSDDELDALELLLQLRDSLLDRGLLQSLGELLRVDSDWEGTNGAQLTFVFDAVGGGREASE